MGLYKSVEHYLGSTGVLECLDSLKTRGIPLSKILTAVCTHILMGSNSMNRCSEWLQNKDVSTELGLDSGLSQRTINRAVSILGEHSDEIIVKLWEGLDKRYHFENTDVNVDGSAVVVNGPEAELGIDHVLKMTKQPGERHCTVKTMADVHVNTIVKYDRAHDRMAVMGRPGASKNVFDIFERLDIEPNYLLECQ